MATKCQNMPKMQTKYKKKPIKSAKKALKEPEGTKNAAFYFTFYFTFFGVFLAIYKNIVCHSDSVQQTKNLFVTVTQSNKQNKSLLQWFSAKNNIKKNFFFFLWHVTKELKKGKKNILSYLNITSVHKNFHDNMDMTNTTKKLTVVPFYN